MRLYDVEQTAQDNILNNPPTVRYDQDESKFNSKAFETFTY